MKKVKSYKDLLVWQRAMDLLVMCYRLTETFPASERFGLTYQLRKSAVSIPSNTAEGNQRRTTAAYLSYVSIALGSQAELITQLETSRRLKFCSTDEIAPVIDAGKKLDVSCGASPSPSNAEGPLDRGCVFLQSP
jgi:four helix bundle protein